MLPRRQNWPLPSVSVGRNCLRPKSDRIRFEKRGALFASARSDLGSPEVNHLAPIIANRSPIGPVGPFGEHFARDFSLGIYSLSTRKQSQHCVGCFSDALLALVQTLGVLR